MHFLSLPFWLLNLIIHSKLIGFFYFIHASNTSDRDEDDDNVESLENADKVVDDMQNLRKRISIP